jgi:hypothetical protein
VVIKMLKYQKDRVEELIDIPSSEVDEVISDYESEGARVEKIQQSNKKWTARATFQE